MDPQNHPNNLEILCLLLVDNKKSCSYMTKCTLHVNHCDQIGKACQIRSQGCRVWVKISLKAATSFLIHDLIFTEFKVNFMWDKRW